jgi:hypothetical protein
MLIYLSLIEVYRARAIDHKAGSTVDCVLDETGILAPKYVRSVLDYATGRGIILITAGHSQQMSGFDNWIRYSESSPGNRSRESLAEIAGDSKALSSRPLNGLFIRSFGDCFLRGQALAVTTPGSAIFVSPRELPHLEVRATTLVGIENSACLLNFEKCLPHFPKLNGDDFALILRWSWGAAWHQWIREWKGALRFFPDFDPAGLRIFASEVLPYRQDARLLFPAYLESLLKERGKRSLYLRQEFLLNCLPLHPDIARVKEHLQTIRKALEQESLLF